MPFRGSHGSVAGAALGATLLFALSWGAVRESNGQLAAEAEAPSGRSASNRPELHSTSQAAVEDTDDGVSTDLEQMIETCEATVRDAQIVFEPERQMVVGRTDEVQAVLTVDDAPPTIPDVTEGTIVENLVLRCFVVARLVGQDFIIDPADHQERSFVDQRTVSWIWDVKPTQAGQHRLTLEVVSTVRNQTSATQQYRAIIQVSASPDKNIVEGVFGVLGWLGTTITGVVLAIVTAWATVHFERRGKAKEPPSADQHAVKSNHGENEEDGAT